MDLKNTKATQVPSTRKQSPKKDQPFGIERASPALKNTSLGNKTHKSYQFGIDLELQVLSYVQVQYKAELIAHRYRSPFGEVDLLVRLPKGEILMIEVKSLSSEERREHRLGARQKMRLKRVFLWLAEINANVLFWLVFVDPKGKIQIEDEVFG